MSMNVPIVNTVTQNSTNCAVVSGAINNNFGKTSFKSKIVNSKAEEKINWLGENFSSAMQRFVSGVTALITQPFIDWNNKNTDEETRKTSTARILGKIIAGTLTGVAIRWACVKASENFTRNKNTEQHLIEVGKAAKAKANLIKKDQILLPQKYLNASYREIKNYRGAIGTLAAVVIMVFTNFLIDAPLTTYLTNVFVKKFKNSASGKADEGGK